MPRYIDADKFIKWLDVGHLRSLSEICYSEGDVKVMIDMQPTADVVEVVRCKGCMFWRGKDHDGVCIENGLATRMENEFCSRGKKKGSESDGTTQT